MYDVWFFYYCKSVNLTDFCIFLNFGSLWILRLQHNDIAILRLASPVYFTPTISPACLPIFNFQEQYNDREAVVIGWGNLKAGIITTGNSSSLTNSNYILSLIFLFTKVAFFFRWKSARCLARSIRWDHIQW